MHLRISGLSSSIRQHSFSCFGCIQVLKKFDYLDSRLVGCASMQQKLEAIKRYKWMCTHSALAAMTGDSQRFCHETGLVLSHLELHEVERSFASRAVGTVEEVGISTSLLSIPELVSTGGSSVDIVVCSNLRNYIFKKRCTISHMVR